MIVNVGSTNILKIITVDVVFRRIFPNKELIVNGLDVDSGVGAQPFSEEDIWKGALNRALKSFNDCDYGVGIEAGLFKFQYLPSSNGAEYHDLCACVIYDGNDLMKGSSGSFECPPFIISGILNEGKELGDVVAELTGKRYTKYTGGVVGFISKDMYDRMEYIKSAVLKAAFRLINPELYLRED